MAGEGVLKQMRDISVPAFGGSMPESAASPDVDIVLQAMRPLVRDIHRILGGNCEVVLHDFRVPSASVIEIAGKLTDRDVGAPVNETNNWLISHGQDIRQKAESFIRTPRGRILKNSTTLFRSRDGKAFGALCINIDMTDILAAAKTMTALAGIDDLTPEQAIVNNDISYVVQTVLTTEQTRTGRRLDFATRDDRLHIFRVLQEHGVFKLQRAVPRIAEHFGISRATIYSYLKTLGEQADI